MMWVVSVKQGGIVPGWEPAGGWRRGDACDQSTSEPGMKIEKWSPLKLFKREGLRERGWICSKYIICMYGNIMKHLWTIH
jgi:hypothetical protein